MRFLTAGILVFLSTLAVFALSLNSLWATDHPTSLLELSYALWARHSVALGSVGQFNPQSTDDFVYMGRYYSALAPGASVLALPLVGLGFMLDGKFVVFGDAMLLSELFIALCNAIAAYLVFKLGSVYFGQRTSVFLAFAYAFSTISWPFATYFFESDVSTMLDLLAVYLAVRMARRESPSLALAVFCGAALGAALTVDYVNAVLVPIVSAFLLYTFRNDLAAFAKGFVGMVGCTALGGVLLALYDQAAFGDPLTTSQQAFGHGSILGSFSYPLPSGLDVDLFSPLRGIFVYCPFLAVGVLGFYTVWRSGELRSEWLLLAACFLGILVPYAMWFDVAGGAGFGQRFLIPAIPFLLLPSGFVIDRTSRGVTALAYLLYAVGVLINGIAGVTTAIPQVESFSKFPFLTDVLPRFLAGGLDTWWRNWAGGLWWAPAVLIIATALLLPLGAWAKSS